MKELGQRYKARLSDLLDDPYSEENIIVTNNNNASVTIICPYDELSL